MLSYTAHAKKRMRQRKIIESEIEYCIEHYEIELPGKKGKIIYKCHTPTGRYLKVVIWKRNPNRILVVTVGD
jgi:hypothetical protein